jgi:hypothetical protein
LKSGSRGNWRRWGRGVDMDISRTIQQTESTEWVDSFFDGTFNGDIKFPFSRTVKHVHIGDYLYLIYKGRYCGRMRITHVNQGHKTVRVGSGKTPVIGRTVVRVRC